MVDIEIDEDQHEYLDQLRSELADEHVGDYGHVRYRDALQYLIDHYDATDGEVDAAPATEETDEEESGERAPAGDGDEAGDEEASGPEDPDDAEADSGSTSRLQRMQALLDDHDDVWERTDSEDGRYTVTLPDGSTETVRTKDDVRALLFQHYD